MRPEFEEKTYENLMNIAFACEFNAINIFAPGQILENDLGFDVTMNIKNKKFFKNYLKKWRYFSHINYKNLKIKNEKLEQVLKNSKVNFNIFIQYKRSNFFYKTNAKCYQYWNKPFYRYELYIKQHKILLDFYKNIKNKSLIIYAAPAFHTFKELFKYINNYRELIKNSNFCDVGKLNNNHNNEHKYVSFIKGGKYNIACSELEKIENLNIREEIEKLKKYKNNDLNLLHLRIKHFCEVIDKIMNNNEDNINHLKSTYKFLIEIFPFKEFNTITMIYKLQLFQLLTNTNILWNIENEPNLWDRIIRKNPVLAI